MKKRIYALIVVPSMLLNACIIRNEVDIPTATLDVLLTPTSTVSLLAAENQPATPDFLNSQIAPGFLLADSKAPDCQLPCWQGLQVGISDRADIQSTLDNIFHFNGTVDFFNYHSLSANDISAFNLDIPGVEAGGYRWFVGNGSFSISMLVDVNTGILQGIQFIHLPDDIQYEIHTPQQVIQELGKPSDAYIDVFGNGGIRLMLVYLDGIVSYSAVLASSTKSSSGEEASSLYCLNQPVDALKDYIVEPITDLHVERMSLIQAKWFGEDMRNLSPLEVVIGITLDDLTRIALEEDEPCFNIDYDKIPSS